MASELGFRRRRASSNLRLRMKGPAAHGTCRRWHAQRRPDLSGGAQACWSGLGGRVSRPAAGCRSGPQGRAIVSMEDHASGACVLAAWCAPLSAKLASERAQPGILLLCDFRRWQGVRGSEADTDVCTTLTSAPRCHREQNLPDRGMCCCVEMSCVCWQARRCAQFYFGFQIQESR